MLNESASRPEASESPLPPPELVEDFEILVESKAPSLLRRLLTTYRHALGLLGGGLIAYLRALPPPRQRGLRYRWLRFINFFTRPFVDRKLRDLPFPVQLRKRLETLGPTYIKLGQVLAMRRDLLPDRVTAELANLLDRLPAVPYKRFLELVERDLGRDPFEIFAYVEAKPMGSASIGQVHRAGTRDGHPVILKVVKPGIREILKRDLALLRTLGRLLEMLIPRFQPKRAIDEFCYYTMRELDLELEADNAEIFAANFSDQPDIVFPRIFRQYSGPTVLCMEYLRGVKPNSAEALALPQLDREKLVDLGAAAIIRMLYRDGYFHADLHPGNLLVLPGPRLGFIDLGMVGRFEEELRRNLLYYYYSLVVGDAESAARYLTGIAKAGRGSDPQGFLRDVADVSRRWRRQVASQGTSVGQLILESVAKGARYKMYFPVELILMVKAIVTFESVGQLMLPGLDVTDYSQKHLNGVLYYQLNPLRLARESLRGAPEFLDTLVKVPMLITAGLRALEQATSRPPENPFAGMRGTMYAGFCLIAGAILAAFGRPIYLWGPLFILSGLLALRRNK